MKIQSRLLLLMLFTTTFTMVTALLVTSYLTREALETAAKDKLAVVLEARESALKHWADEQKEDLTIMAFAPGTIMFLRDLNTEFKKLGNNAQTLLQQHYLASERDYKTASPQPAIAAYDKAHRLATPFFSRRYNTYGWEDVLLIDTQGNVIYSLQKENDFATNLRIGPWRDSGLARAVMPLLQAPIPGQLSFSDYSQHAPSQMRPACFMAMPVFDEEKQQLLGIVAIQLPITGLNALMADKSGMGETGEVVLVGKNHHLLTDSRFSKESVALKKQIFSKPSQTVLAGKTATLITPDFRGIEVIASFKPFTPFPAALGDNVLWGIIAKIDYAEVLQAYNNLLRVFVFITVGLILFALSLGIWGGRVITRPLLRITDALTRLANGEKISVPELKRTDEIGAIAKAAETFRSLAQQTEQEHWLSENVTLLTNAVSMENSINKAAERILHLLCDLLSIPVGAIYLLHQGRYQRISTHGLARSNQAEISFEPGVGLLGECAKSNQPLVLSPVPAGLTIISSGLAEFSPHELIIYPIEHKNEVLIVLELAATSSLEPKGHAFLKAASAALGLYFANLQSAEHNSLLLAEIGQQATELRASSAYARSLLEASLDPLVTIGVNGKIMDVNMATEKVTGVARDQLIGSDFCDYFTEPDKARNGYQQVFSKGFVVDYPLAIRHATGNITDVLYNASVYRDSQGEVAGIFAAARDITDKKKAEQTLREQQESLLLSNTELKTLSEELRSQSEEMKAQNEALKSSEEELRAQQEEVLQKNQLLETQSRRLKEVITQTQEKAAELQQANLYKSEFLANMSHELRTPLNSILILSKSLAENEDHNLSADQIESATVISESGTQLLTLINDILDLSKIEAGKLELVKESFPLENLLAYLRRVFLPQSVRKNLAFTIDVAPGVPEQFYTDKQRLTQVLSNLLTNAIKFTDAGSVQVSIKKIDDDCQIEVMDTGIGIPADKLEHIFGAFQQLDGSTSRKYGGSGLGLAISRNLVHLLNGEITVDSVIGRGSRFIIRLSKLFAPSEKPAQEQLPTPAPSAVAAVTATAGGNILIVEDDARLLALLGRMITSLGFTVIAVETAEQALATLTETPLTGIFIDLLLPKMSGMELLRQLKTSEATAKIPVFIMSGTVDTGEAKTLGALGFLEKPVSRSTIIGALKTMVQVTHDVAVPQILLIEGNPIDIKFIENKLKDIGIKIVTTDTGSEALQLLETQSFAVVILALQLSDMSGFDWLKVAQNKLNPPPVITYTARELTENEVFELKGVTESIVTKSALSNRLREEVLHALHLTDSAATVSSEQPLGKKLLLVDDDARNLYALTKALKNKGFVVEVASDSMKALELLAQTAFDALLTDIMMPQVDGYELIRRVRALGYDKLPIIAITAKAMQGDDTLCLQAGANAYLAKPVEVNALIELIASIGASPQ